MPAFLTTRARPCPWRQFQTGSALGALCFHDPVRQTANNKGTCRASLSWQLASGVVRSITYLTGRLPSAKCFARTIAEGRVWRVQCVVPGLINMRVDCSFGAARDAHRVEVPILRKAVIVSVVLIGEDFIVVCLAAPIPSGTIRDSRVHDNVAIATLVVAEVVLAPTKHLAKERRRTSSGSWTRCGR